MTWNYIGYLVDWLVGATAAIGDWFGRAAYQVTHDVVWGSIAGGVVLLLLVLYYLGRRASR